MPVSMPSKENLTYKRVPMIGPSVRTELPEETSQTKTRLHQILLLVVQFKLLTFSVKGKVHVTGTGSPHVCFI